MTLVETTARREGPAPELSILVPTYDWDVRLLVAELLDGMAALSDPRSAELVVLVDGNPALARQGEVVAMAEARGLALAFDEAAPNRGRAGARNHLAELAHGAHVLFLDADGLPDNPDFVARALAAARAQPDAVVCGGRTGKRVAPAPRDSRLFEAHSRKREWIPAEARNRDPAGNFLSANFHLRRDLFRSVPFDARFTGWGWEDTDWALRIGAHAPIVHVDNPVTHMEHHADARWLDRLDRSAENYRMLWQAHPDAVARHRLMPLIRALYPFRGSAWLRAALLRVALWPALPAGLRLKVAKLRQALLYSAVLS